MLTDMFIIGIGTMIFLVPVGLTIFNKWDEMEETTFGKIYPVLCGLMLILAFATKCK